MKYSKKFIIGFATVFLFCMNIYADNISSGKILYSSKNDTNMKIALTFDDGPHPRDTIEILDILKEYGVHATFFVVGKNVQKYPELIMREVAEGHEIGNHTYSHINLRKAKKSTLEREILLNENIIYEICEYRPKLFRPPEGVYNRMVCASMEKLDYRIVLWTIDTKDWTKPSSDKIYDTVTEKVKSGNIILFHDLVVGESSTPDALRKIIPELLSRGYKFVTVSELIQSGEN